MREGWILMGNGLRWDGLEIAADIVGVEDPELWIAGLVTIRDWFEAKQRADIARQRRTAG